MRQTKESLQFLTSDQCPGFAIVPWGLDAPLMCCGQQLQKLVPGQVDAAVEKHQPVVLRQDDTVTVEVGQNHHPMGEEHVIDWVFLQTDCGGHYHLLTAQSQPVCQFVLAPGESPVAVYAHCNLHGLWRQDI